MKGIFGVYKPKGPTSNDVLKIIKKKTGEKKVGHAGTLDPLATGVLVVAVGREWTRQLGNIVKTDKEYIAAIKLGEVSTTDDEEGDKQKIKSEKSDKKQVERAVNHFVGKIMQVPPQFSAVKVKGREAYKMARKGETVQLKPRLVEIKKIEILNYKWPNLKLKVVCGSGTYIRALARDIGGALGTGAYLKDLERTRVGEFKKDDCIKL